VSNSPTHPTTAGSPALPGPDDTLRQVLPNGITLLVRENFASPAVVVSGYLRAGSRDEPAGKYGLAGFATDVMERGTETRSFDELYETVESIGAGFGLGSGVHISSFGAKGLAEHLPLLLDILGDVLRRPAFDVRQVEKTRAEILTDLQERDNDSSRQAGLKFYELAYPASHPYHWSQTGYPDTVAGITRDDLAAYHATNFSPEGMVLVIVGGIETKAAVEAAQAIFGDWSTSRPQRAPLGPAPDLTERREARMTLEDKSQSSLCLGWPGPARAHPDFIPAHVTNTVLGVFGMYGRLGQRIREDRGLAYYVHSRVDGGAGPGPWRITAGLDPANVDEGCDLILQTLDEFRNNRVTDEELQDSQSFLAGSLPLYLESNEGVARSLVNIERYTLGLDYLQRYASLIKSVTPEQVQAVAQRWLDTDHFVLTVAGPETPAGDGTGS
jgi:zinc protease